MHEPTLIRNSKSNSGGNPRASQIPLGIARKLESFWILRYGVIILCCVSFVIWYLRFIKDRDYRSTKIKDEPWDFLLFTQSYQITTCIWWKDEQDDDCKFSRNKYEWTVHGIWPTKNDTEGPFNCRRLPFDETKLQSLKPELEEHWLSIGYSMKNSNFWKHEWLKHGTCAVEDPLFDSEITYFKLGLEFNKRWNISSILDQQGISPSDTKTYSNAQFHDAIKSYLGYGPFLHCYEHKDVHLISEVRLCISKKLTLIDCDEQYGPKFSDCPDDGFFYPRTLDTSKFIRKN